MHKRKGNKNEIEELKVEQVLQSYFLAKTAEIYCQNYCFYWFSSQLKVVQGNTPGVSRARLFIPTEVIPTMQNRG